MIAVPRAYSTQAFDDARIADDIFSATDTNILSSQMKDKRTIMDLQDETIDQAVRPLMSTGVDQPLHRLPIGRGNLPAEDDRGL